MMHPIHPMLVHFPIALLSASVGFDLLAQRWRRDECRIAGLYTLVLGVAGALVSVASGAMAEDAVEHSGVPKQVLEMHEALGLSGVAVLLVASYYGGSLVYDYAAGVTAPR